MTEARLGIAIETIGAKEGSQQLLVLTNASRRAEAATTSVSAASKRAEAAMRGEGAAANAAAKALEAHRVAANANNAVVVAGAAGAKASSFQMRMMAMQLSQVGQQTMATGNFMQALAIQLPDMALGFGTVGIAIGVFLGILLQMVDGGKAAGAVLRVLADGLQVIAPYAAAAAAGLALIYAPAVFAGFAALTSAVASVGRAVIGLAATFAMANPGAALVLGMVAAVAAMSAFRDDITRIFGRDIVGDVKTAANTIIGLFVGAFEAVKATWSQLPGAMGDLAYSAANAVVGGVEMMLNYVIDKVNDFISKIDGVITTVSGWVGRDSVPLDRLQRVTIQRPTNPHPGAASGVASAAQDAMKGAMGRDYVSETITGIGNAAGAASSKVRELAGWLEKTDAKDKKKRGKSDTDKFSDITGRAERRIAEMKAEEAALGMTGEAAQRLRYETELLNEAQQRGLNLTPAQTAALKALAATMAEVHSSLQFTNLMKDANERLAALKAEQAAVGLSAVAAAKLRYETDMLNQAERDGITLTAERRAVLAGMAQEMANVEVATRKAEEALALAKDVTKGFFSDLMGGLEQGKSFWESFADAALNALNKIVDKLLNDVIDAIFSVQSAASGGGGNWLSSLFGSLFGGGGGFNLGTSALGLYAQGGRVSGAGTGTSDSIVARVSNGEFIVNANATRAFLPLLEEINSGKMPTFKRGGIVVGSVPAIPQNRPAAMIGAQTAANSNAPAAANQNVHVTVGVTVDKNGNLQAYVKDVAQGEMARGLKRYTGSAEFNAGVIQGVRKAQRGNYKLG